MRQLTFKDVKQGEPFLTALPAEPELYAWRVPVSRSSYRDLVAGYAHGPTRVLVDPDMVVYVKEV